MRAGDMTPSSQMVRSAKAVLQQRILLLSESKKQTQSQNVAQMLFKVPQYKNSKRVSLYLNMGEELQTEMDYQRLPESKWHIKQPGDDDVREDALSTGGLDLILMPGLGSTSNGARLGRGKGYYDTYLAKCSNQGRKPFMIALAFNEQICESVPMSDTDIRLDMVLFPDMPAAV
ncbi:hypothetical protein ScPMuIL_018899 [Solemya velum]